MDGRRNAFIGLGTIALIYGILYLSWFALPIGNAQTLRFALIAGVPIISLYAVRTHFASNELRSTWSTIALVLLATVLSGWILQVFGGRLIELGYTRVSLDGVVACLLGTVWLGLWLVQRGRGASAKYSSLAVALTFIISGLLHVLLDYGLNYTRL